MVETFASDVQAQGGALRTATPSRAALPPAGRGSRAGLPTSIMVEGIVFELPAVGAPDEAMRLRELVLAINQRRAKMEAMVTCPICLDRERNTAFAPCGHVTCNACARALRQRGPNADGAEDSGMLCPQCYRPYTSLMPVFL